MCYSTPKAEPGLQCCEGTDGRLYLKGCKSVEIKVPVEWKVKKKSVLKF